MQKCETVFHSVQNSVSVGVISESLYKELMLKFAE